MFRKGLKIICVMHGTGIIWLQTQSGLSFSNRESSIDFELGVPLYDESHVINFYTDNLLE